MVLPFMIKQDVKLFIEVTVNLVKRDIKTKYSSSILGPLWVVLFPITLTFVSTIIFSLIIQGDVGNVPYFLFAMIGFVNWLYFMQSMTIATRSLVSNRVLVCNANLPKQSIVLSVILSRALDYLVGLLVFVLIYFWTQKVFLITELLLLLGISFFQIVLQTGLCLITASLNVYYRDVQNIVDIFLKILFYLTPVMYPVSIVPEMYKGLVNFNPLSMIISLSRAVIFKQGVDMISLFAVIFISISFLVLGIFIFAKLEDKFAELI